MTTTDRRGADTATFEAELARLDRLEVADEDTEERVARAIGDVAYNGFPWAEMDEFEHEEYREQARAAIAALKPAPGTDSSGQASCGHLSPAYFSGEQLMCELPYGHGGAHQQSIGGLPPTRWVEADSSGQAVQRVLDLRERVHGLVVAHHIAADANGELFADRLDDLLRAAVAGPQRDHGEGAVSTIRMTVTSIAGEVITLDHQVADDERHPDGYTGAELRLWFRDLRHVRQDDGSTIAQKVEPGDLPLAVGQIVEVTVTATADTRPVERFVDDDGDGIPDRRVVVDPLANDPAVAVSTPEPVVVLCGPPKGCTCPAVAWGCCCAASEHGRRMIAGLACDCGFCSAGARDGAR